MKRFENKVAFITGGNSGIGKAAAILIAREGANVAIADLKENKETIAQIKNEGANAIFIQCDVSNPQQVEQAVSKTVEAFGKLDIALNSAGTTDKNMSPIHEKGFEEWQKVQDINLGGVFYGMKYQIAQMRKQPSGGNIVNIGSSMSLVSMGGLASYVSSKHGLVGITKTAALENATENIRVNSIAPGYIASPMLLDGIKGNEQTRKYMEGLHPMNRLGEPEEIAKTFLFLASEDASFITGVVLQVDGGYVIR